MIFETMTKPYSWVTVYGGDIIGNVITFTYAEMKQQNGNIVHPTKLLT